MFKISTRKFVLVMLVLTLCALVWFRPDQYMETFKNSLALAMGFYFGQARPAGKDDDKASDQKE